MMYNYRDGRSNIINILKTETDVIKSSGIPIKVNYLSSKLAVSDRTNQKIIKES